MNNYDLEERTIRFSIDLLNLIKTLGNSFTNRHITDQVLRSGTSIGANYHEANGSETTKDFINKVKISKQEAKETNYWLKILLYTNPTQAKSISTLIQESLELIKILTTIIKNSKN